MKRITPLLRTWSAYSAEERLDHNAYFAQGAAGEPGVVVDPVAFQPGDVEELRELGGVVAVVLTDEDKGRRARADRLAQELGCPVHAPGTLEGGAALPGGLASIRLSDGRVVFLHRRGRAWLVGDCVVGEPAGEISLPAAVTSEGDRASAARGLRLLLDEFFQRVLPFRGTPVLREATEA